MKDNNIVNLQFEYDTMFYLADQDLENCIIYDDMYHIGQKLNYQLVKQHEFLRQQSKVLWLQRGVSNTRYFYAKMLM